MTRLLGCMLPLVLLVALVAGCPQGDGDRCEIDSDCGKGLVCCSGSNTCRPSCQTSQPDAAVIPDARVDQDATVLEDAEVPLDGETLLDAEISQDASP